MMSFCSPSEILPCFIYYIFDLLPLIALILILISNITDQKLRQQRNIFINKKQEIVLDWTVLGSKFIFISFNLLSTILQITLCILYHTDLSLFLNIFSESCFLVFWISQIAILAYDANNYGQTSSSSRVSYLVKKLSLL